MIRKICVLFLITILSRAGNCYQEDEPGYLSKLTDIPFNIIDLPLATANDALYNTLNFASNFVQTVTSKVGSVTKKILDSARNIAEGTIESVRSVVKALKDAKDGIITTLKGIRNDMSGAGKEYLNKLKDVRESVLKDALKKGHEFLKNASEAAHNQMENAFHAGQEALEKATELAKNVIEEAKQKGETTKAEVLEKLKDELETLQVQYKNIKAEMFEELRKLADKIKAHIGEEKYEEYKKKLDDFFHKLKSVLDDGSAVANKVKNKIEEFLKTGKEALGNWSEELKPKVEHIKEKLRELQSKASAYKDNVVAAAKEKIAQIAEKSKGVLNSFFEGLGKVVKNSVDHLKKIFNATASLVGDFLNKGKSKGESHGNLPVETETEQPVTEKEEPTTNQPTEAPKPEEKEDDEAVIDDPLIYDIDVRVRSANGVGDELSNIADNFDEEIKFPSSAEKIDDNSESSEKSNTNSDEIPNVDFGKDCVEKAESAFNKLLEKIKEITENGKKTIGDLFEKGLVLYENCMAKLDSSISEHMKFIQEKVQKMKEYLQELIKNIGEKIREAKRKFVDWISDISSKIKNAINKRANDMSNQAKEQTEKAKELYYKIQDKLNELKYKANEKLEEFKAQANVKVADAIEKTKDTAEKIKEFVEKKFLGGAKRSMECYNEHKDEISELVSNATKDISNCGKKGLKEITQAINKSLNPEGFSDKVSQLEKEYTKCKKNAGIFGGISCLTKLPYNEVLNIREASADIVNAAKTAHQIVSSCANEKVELNKVSFNKLHDEIEQCLAHQEE